jgi:hypothetical protein
VIFHSYVSLLEGIQQQLDGLTSDDHPHQAFFYKRYAQRPD